MDGFFTGADTASVWIFVFIFSLSSRSFPFAASIQATTVSAVVSARDIHLFFASSSSASFSEKNASTFPSISHFLFSHFSISDERNVSASEATLSTIVATFDLSVSKS